MWAQKKTWIILRKKLTTRITAYRAGYQADERREIEDGLKSRKYLGVTCTNALELEYQYRVHLMQLLFQNVRNYDFHMATRSWKGRQKQSEIITLVAFESI